MSAPDVTVVSAVYNLVEEGRAETFTQMVASVARQDLPGVEHIVVDGASRDGTASLLKKEAAAHPGLEILSEPDRGIYDAMNKGAARARGRYLAFLNSDDFYHDTSGLARAVAKLDQTRAGLGYGTAQVLKADGRVKPLRPKMARFLRGMPFNHQTMLLRRDLFESLGGYDIDLRILSDFRMTLGLLLGTYQAVDLGAPMVSFRAGGASADRAQVAREKAAIYARAFAPFAELSEPDWHRFAMRGKLPLRLLIRLVGDNRCNARTRRAALYEMQNNLFKPGL